MKTLARAALGIAAGNQLSAAIAATPALMESAWLIATLALHATAVKSYAAAHPER